ncbi:hypothetical protein EP56_05630 [Listeriaceae bacterium FSL A5-0209]|nr:hypothetical protein EP56_05630 [Listeriaceae bacterium FSL A5-0209]
MALNNENKKQDSWDVKADLKIDDEQFFKIGLDAISDIKTPFGLGSNERQNDIFRWLEGLEDFDKVTIERRDGSKIEAIARRKVTMEEMSLENTHRVKTSLWFTNIRIDLSTDHKEAYNDEN